MTSANKASRRGVFAWTLALPALGLALAGRASAREADTGAKAGGNRVARTRQEEQAELLDKLACRTLMDTYWFGEITRNPDIFASVWTEDAVFGSVRGRDNIRAACVEFLKGMEVITDLRSSPAGWHVVVNGDTARGQFYLLAHLKIKQPDGSSKVEVADATYTTEFVRTPEGWLMSRCTGLKNPKIFHDSDISAQLLPLKASEAFPTPVER